MKLGYDHDLYILAFDHRGSFQKNLFGITGTPTAEETKKICDAKALIFEGFVEAQKQGLPEGCGILVDEQFGSQVAKQAKAMGIILSMPAEASGREDFEFEYGDDFGKHIEAFDPNFTKVLVRYNPAWTGDINATQTAKLKKLADWLHAHNRLFLFELLVPATKEQLASVGGSQDRYDKEVRPGLVRDSIAALQQAGVEADVWKIEGLDDREDCRKTAELARSGGRDKVICVVLGRGAGTDKVDHWLRAGAGLPGYRGFAIGRTIWWDALVGVRDGKMSRPDAAKLIAKNYLHSIQVYQAGSKA